MGWIVTRKKKMPVKRQPCTIEGVHYESESVASRALGIHLNTMRSRFRSSLFPEYVSEYHKKRKCTKKTFSIPCTIEGVEYPSITNAARVLGKRPSTISNRLISFNYPDYVCAELPKQKPKYTYKVNGKRYKTLQEIADAEGVTKERIRQKMNNPKKTEYQRF